MKLSESRGREAVICEIKKRRLKPFYVAGNESFVSNAKKLSAPGRDDEAPWGEGWGRCQPPVTRGHVWGKKCQSHQSPVLTWVRGKPGSQQSFSLVTSETCDLPLSGRNWCTSILKTVQSFPSPGDLHFKKRTVEGNTGEKEAKRQECISGTGKRDFWVRTCPRSLKSTP